MSMRRSVFASGLAAALGLFHSGSAALAQDAAAPQAAAPDAAAKALSIELNKSANSGTGCRLTFVAKNETGVDLSKTSYEIAVFDANNQVAKLLVFAFGALPQNKTKVVEFEYPNLACTGISRILVNTSPECLANGAASPVCLDALKTGSLTPIAFNQ